MFFREVRACDWARKKTAHEDLADAYLEDIEAYAMSLGIAPSKRMADVAGEMGVMPILPPQEVTPASLQ